LIPAFIISELKTAFSNWIFVVHTILDLDMVVASVLMAMGMMMAPSSRSVRCHLSFYFLFW